MYVFGGLMAILVASVIIVPLIEKGRGAGREPTPREQRDQAIEALQELEFEFQTGKLALEDYTPLRNRYARKAIEARDALIAAGQDVGTPAMTDRAPDTCPDCNAPVDPEGAGRFCTICGASLTVGGAGAVPA